MSKKKITFGPVISRRLGLSLGVDLVPKKKCNLDCIYCEVCPTDMHDEDRIEHINIEDLVDEIRNVQGDIDYITLTGAGEPTLHKDLDKIIRRLKSEFSYPIVMLTNSLLLRHEDVRKELLGLDLIVPSLDSVNQESFEKVNRPIAGVLIKDVIEGLIKFKSEFSGKMWLEVLLVKGINDSSFDILELDKVVKMIDPDKVQLNTVVRAPAYKEAASLSFEELRLIANSLFSGNVEIIGAPSKVSEFAVVSDERLISYLLRRPAVFEELIAAFNVKPAELRKMLTSLESEGKVIKENHDGSVFFKA